MSQVAVQASGSRSIRNPWFLFHLCDLDAPAVAIVWQLLLATSFAAPLRLPAIVALGLSVWLIYAADRLLDGLPGRVNAATARHRFHRSYRRTLLLALLAATTSLGLVCTRLRPAVFRGGLLLGLGILLYMAAVHLVPYASCRAVPKEINVGVLFALGTCLAPACVSGLSASFLMAGLLFAALCCLNCCAIEVWEWTSASQTPHALTRWFVGRLQPLLWLVIAVAAVQLFLAGPERFDAAVIVSALGFIAVASLRGRISTDLLRVLTDLPLLSPILFLMLPAR